jgi:hypothetical protein
MKKKEILLLCACLLLTACGKPKLTEGEDDWNSSMEMETDSDHDKVVALDLSKGKTFSEGESSYAGEEAPAEGQSAGHDAGKKSKEITVKSRGSEASEAKASESGTKPGKQASSTPAGSEEDPSEKEASSSSKGTGSDKGTSAQASSDAGDANNEKPEGKPIKLDKDGYYSGSLSQRKSSFSTVNDLKIEGNRLYIKGNLDYSAGKPADARQKEDRPVQEYILELTDDTVFETAGGLADPNPISRQDFIDLYPQIKSGGLGLIIELDKGKVKVVCLTS